MSIFVSIIVPIYNCKDYIYECVDSLIQQSYENIEIILVDDGSTDGSERICDEYAKKYSNIVVLHKQNGGLSDARNAGIRCAKGEYVTFVDGDDIVGKDMVSIMAKLADRESAEIVKIALIRKADNEERISTEGEYEILNSDIALKRIYKDPPQIISGCGKLFARSLFDKVCFPVGMYYEDEYAVPQLYAAAERIVFSKSIQYFYMQRLNDSIMRSAFTEKKCRDALKVVQDRIVFFETLKNAKLVKSAKRDYYLKLISLHNQSRKFLNSEIVKELEMYIEEFKRKEAFIYGAIIIREKMYRVLKWFRKIFL